MAVQSGSAADRFASGSRTKPTSAVPTVSPKATAQPMNRQGFAVANGPCFRATGYSAFATTGTATAPGAGRVARSKIG